MGMHLKFKFLANFSIFGVMLSYQSFNKHDFGEIREGQKKFFIVDFQMAHLLQILKLDLGVYIITLQVGDAFHAYKVHDWYKLLPTVTYDTLDADKAEERFQQRNKVMNQFALKAQIQQEIKKEEGEEVVTTKAASLVCLVPKSIFNRFLENQR